jgi:hypothetical protein
MELPEDMWRVIAIEVRKLCWMSAVSLAATCWDQWRLYVQTTPAMVRYTFIDLVYLDYDQAQLWSPQTGWVEPQDREWKWAVQWNKYHEYREGYVLEIRLRIYRHKLWRDPERDAKKRKDLQWKKTQWKRGNYDDC